MAEKEIWKDIEGFSNYQISNFGRVKNKTTNTIKAVDVNPRDGYAYTDLYKNNIRYKRKVHRLVAQAFCDAVDLSLEVNHLDGDKTNNRFDNLEWCTRSENMKHAHKNGLTYKSEYAGKLKKKVRIMETGEEFDSLKDCANAIGCAKPTVSMCLNDRCTNKTVHGLHLEAIDKKEENKPKSILRDFQYDAVNRMSNGCILNGGTGSGKSRTGLYYYFKCQGGSYVGDEYVPMKKPKNLLIITTAKKRDSLEFEGELALFRMSTDPEVNYYNNTIIIDSWQNIKKYADLVGWYIIYDEDFLTGKGTWVKTYLKMVKNNDWIIMSASPGDTYEQYLPVFIANGFFKNRSEFYREHCVFSRYTKYPKIERYLNTRRLDRLRDRLLIDMDFERHTVQNHEDIYVQYNIATYKDVIRRRWDVYRDEPITQASGLCYVLRKVVNSSEDRQRTVLELLEDHPRAIIFFSFDYEREILLNLGYSEGTEIAEWTGHKHEPIPTGDRWVYLVNYSAGAEGFNCITTNTIIFYSQTYSYKTMLQAAGRIDRLTSPYKDLYYYHLKSRSGIDLAISKALSEKKKFNETKWLSSFN